MVAGDGTQRTSTERLAEACGVAHRVSFLGSVGEPLNPAIVYWGRKIFGCEIYDTWFQTETGSIMISNYPGMPIKPGSMGKPQPGIEAAVVDENGKVHYTDQPPPSSSRVTCSPDARASQRNPRTRSARRRCRRSADRPG